MPPHKEVTEQGSMQLVADRLTEVGLKIEIQWNRPDVSAFPDYKGSVNGQPWAFEITQIMRPNPKGFIYIHNSEDLEKLGESMLPQVPTDLETLQEVLQERIREKSASKRTNKLDQNEKYCLILIDNQFFYDENWLHTLATQDYSAFDAVVTIQSQEPFGYDSPSQEAETKVVACPKIPTEWSQHIPNYKEVLDDTTIANLDILRRQWCKEPTVTAAKGTGTTE